MKVKFFSLIIIACLCFGACSKQNAENIYSEKSMEQSSPSGSLSLDYDVQILSQETMDALSEDKFRWGGRGSSDNRQYISIGGENRIDNLMDVHFSYDR